MILVPLADIAGAGVAVQLGTSGVARSIIFTITTGTGIVRVGDSTVSATKGSSVPSLASGQQLVLPVSSDLNERYGLASTYVYIGNSTTVSITLIV
jgi:hypothetical protein